ncbi:hypothetical protein IFO68_14770 [Photobacterium sp. CAU 1568]|uniref:Transporter n=1 Tax=Photobacterium arenosum TaxID=2774143 RepID=A0ABR9BN14_9GAMM|nr:hypothetical protein [Photobacterium arenosum]MBD8513944.1 hypothetical protein [Photobacterium arenosum]
MKTIHNNRFTIACLICLVAVSPAYGMGLRSFVALPVDKGGTVLRTTFEHISGLDTDVLSLSAAYGLTAEQTLLLGIPYRLSPGGADQHGDLSVLYRYMAWQQDSLTGTRRIGVLGGAIVPTEASRDAAIQSGFVFTHFQDRHEIDIDVLYQAGVEHRPNSGRYDISWQYRLLPEERPDWGIPPELNSVMEFNGRWREGGSLVHQLTAGVQWIHPTWVLEGGVIRDLNAAQNWHYLLSTRFHF